ncbi:hypothetical protein CAC42_2056 [Sphaceloma murrayae]|uniref:Efflux pump dotC n=1 Tax=Sphaceloma murrayae TaxID=2082308 RepID=A0A2K1QI49_9PEZI|nr:hypothetical protein CAC42_2056 [Sphaceloma murrayae]
MDPSPSPPTSRQLVTNSSHDVSSTSVPDSAHPDGSLDEKHHRDLETGQRQDSRGSPVTTADNHMELNAPTRRSKSNLALIMVALCLAVFLGALDVTIVTTALPTISKYFQSDAGFTWIGSAFLLGNAASIPIWAKVSDIFGRKPMLLLANVIFMVGSLLCGLASSVNMLIAARAVQGLGGGGLTILAKIVIGDIVPLNIRSAFYGVIGGVWAIAAASGPLMGGVFTEKLSWRWCFYINLPLDGVAFAIILLFLDLHTPPTPLRAGLQAIDWTGCLLVISGTVMFLIGLEVGGNTAPWASAEVICLLVFAVITWTAFVFWEARYARYPVMPMGLFRKATNAATLFCVFIQGVVFISANFYLPLYFQAVRGGTPIQSGVYVLPTAIALSVGSIGTGMVVAKTGWYMQLMSIGLFLMTLGFGLFVDLDPTSSWPKLIMYQVIAGLGVGPLFQAPIIALHAHIEPRDISTATSTLGFIRQLAQAISVVIGQAVFQNEMTKRYPVLVASGIPADIAETLSTGSTSADPQLINGLPSDQRGVFRSSLADSLSPMWLMFTAIAAVGLIASFSVKKKVLTHDHIETRTGLDAERENAEARRLERESRKRG